MTAEPFVIPNEVRDLGRSNPLSWHALIAQRGHWFRGTWRYILTMKEEKQVEVTDRNLRAKSLSGGRAKRQGLDQAVHRKGDPPRTLAGSNSCGVTVKLG